MFPSILSSNSNYDLPISQYLQTRFDKRMRLFGSILFTFATVSLHVLLLKGQCQTEERERRHRKSQFIQLTTTTTTTSRCFVS